jgi:hypothetical protein
MIRHFRSGRFATSIVTLVAALLATASQVSAFTVIKNVNTGQPPVEKLVIFDKTRGAANKVVLVGNGAPIAINADGAIQIDIVGNAEAKPEINWKADGALGETFDSTQYNFLLLTCHIEGKSVKTDPITGKTQDMPAKGNMYYAAVLHDKDGQGVGYANLADVSEDGTTPLTAVTLPMPMNLFYKGSPNDIHHIKGIAFPWGTTHPEISRDYHIIIDKIALAE